MSWLADLEPSLVRLLVDGAEELASFALHKLRGDGSEADAEGNLAASELARRGLEALIAGLEAEIAHQAAILGIVDATERMRLGSMGVLDAFTPKGEFPSIADPANIEIMPPDWKSEP